MFDSKHYIPILKWKAAERQALEKLDPKAKKFISPLVQVIMPSPKPLKRGDRPKTPKEQLEESIASLKIKIPEIAGEILKSWGQDPVFIDLALVDISCKVQGYTTILRKAKDLDMPLIPVIGLSSDKTVQAIVVSLAKENKSGLCLRLFPSDFAEPDNLSDKIKNFLSAYNLTEKDVDLLADFQDEECLKLADLNQLIPNLLKWRTYILACGSFPVDLTKCELGENFIDRKDWKNWITQIDLGKPDRKPSFSDYTIQHPIYRENLQNFSPSASIRYTLKDQWLVMRGQKRKSVQYLANAQLLSKHSKFFGENFSYGDAYIANKGKDLKSEKTGNATTWLVAGINHHLACTVSQIAS